MHRKYRKYRNPPRVSVDDSNKSQSNEKFITIEKVESEDGRYKVKIDVSRIGEEEEIEGDKVVRRAKPKFVIKYRKRRGVGLSEFYERSPLVPIPLSCSPRRSRELPSRTWGISLLLGFTVVF